MVPYVDILIPTKDRAMQLHLLLESMGRHLKNMGRITITWQGSNGEFVKGYELLKQRVNEDSAFALLRKNSKEIIFRQRTSLAEVYEAAMDSGDSNYIMPLVDDDVFIGEYDLVNAPPSRYFFNHTEVLACAIRLGDNLSDQVSHSLADGVLDEKSLGHGTTLLSIGKPRFLYPKLGHTLSNAILEEYKSAEYLLWSWAANLNASHWSCALSTTGHIYRKSFYLDYYQRFGKENFLNIEGKGLNHLIQKAINGNHLLKTANCLDWLQDKFLTKKCFHGEDLFLILLLKHLERSEQLNPAIPYLMVAPRVSVVVNLDVRTSHNRNIGINLIKDWNTQYLHNTLIIDSTPLNGLKVFFPFQVFTEFRLIYYENVPYSDR